MARHSKLYTHQDGLCYICGEKMLTLAECKAGDPLQRTLDHLIPHAWGGKSVPENLVYVHAKCNHTKAHTLPSPLHPWQAKMVANSFHKLMFCCRWVRLANTGAFGTVPQLRRKYARWWLSITTCKGWRKLYVINAFALGKGESRGEFLQRYGLQAGQRTKAQVRVASSVDIRRGRPRTG